MRFPASPGWVSLAVAPGAPRHSWLRAPGAVPRHSWLESAGGGGVWSLATPGCRSRLRFPATPGWGFPGCGSQPLLAEGLGGGSRPLLAGVRRPPRWVFPWVGVSRAVCACGAACARRVCAGVCGVCLWCLCWWWCGCGCAFRVCLCVCVCACVVCWWRAVAGPCFLRLLLCLWECGCCVLWLDPRHSWRRFLCATPRHSWLGFAASGGGCSSPLLAAGPGCGSPPLLAGFRRRWWCGAPPHSWLGPAGCGGVFRGWGCPLLCVFVVCVAARDGRAVLFVACLWCPRCCLCGVVVRRGCVFPMRWCASLRVCGVPVVRGLLSPPLLVGACGWCFCGCGFCVVWVPRDSWLTDLRAVPCHSLLGSAVVWWWLVPCDSRVRGLVAGPPHSWLGFPARCGGWPLATPGRGRWGWFPATPGWGPLVVVVGARSPLLAVGPGVRSVVAVCVRVCACGVWFVGCVIPWLVLVVGRHGRGQKAEEKQKRRSFRCVAEMP